MCCLEPLMSLLFVWFLLVPIAFSYQLMPSYERPMNTKRSSLNRSVQKPSQDLHISSIIGRMYWIWRSSPIYDRDEPIFFLKKERETNLFQDAYGLKHSPTNFDPCVAYTPTPNRSSTFSRQQPNSKASISQLKN